MEANRTSVMTPCASVVLKQLGYDHDEAHRLERAVAGLNAHSKAKWPGLVNPGDEPKGAGRRTVAQDAVPLLGRSVRVVRTGGRVLAVAGDQAVTQASVEECLRRSFGDEFEPVQPAMRKLAASRRPDDPREQGCEL